MATLGAGYSWGNESAYTYLLIDPLFYYGDKFTAGVGGSLGVVFDKYKYMSTNIEASRRFYDSGDAQNLVKATQSFRLSQNFQLQFKYDYKNRFVNSKKESEETYRATLNYYF